MIKRKASMKVIFSCSSPTLHTTVMCATVSLILVPSSGGRGVSPTCLSRWIPSVGGVEGVFPGGQQPQAFPRQGRAEGPIGPVTAGPGASALSMDGCQLAQGHLCKGGP